MKKASLLGVAAVAVGAGAAPGVPVPPRAEEIAGEIRAMREYLDGVRLTFDVESKGYDGSVESGVILTQRSHKVYASRGGIRRHESTLYDMEQPIGTGPRSCGLVVFDGQDTFLVGDAPANPTRPGVPIMVKPGFDSKVFSTHPLYNYESAIWGDLIKPLDEQLTDGYFSWTVAPQPEVIEGQRVWRLNARHVSDGGSDVAEFSAEIWVAPDLGMLPIRSTHRMIRTDGSVQSLMGKSARSFTEVRPGLWIPREIYLGDPTDPNPATGTWIAIRVIDEAPAPEDLLAEISTGTRDMIDFRTNERYIIDGNVRGPSELIANAGKMQKELDRYFNKGAEVRNANLHAGESGWLGGRTVLWSLVSILGLVAVALGIRGFRKA